MSQLNLKQILSGDNLSTVVDKINYNFDQLVLNGGGPQGLRGLIGAPGLPGLQGLMGETGGTGPEGTHLYAAQGLTPGGYPFGTGGEILPRVQDIYIEANPTYINIWELSATGASASYWNLVETVASPSSAWTLVQHQTGTTPDYTDIANDYLTAEMVFIGSTSAYGTGPDNTGRPYLFSDTFAPGTFNTGFSKSSPGSDSLLVLASDTNQLRIISSGLSGATGALGATVQNPSGVQQDRGGVIHSLELVDLGGTDVQTYRIKLAEGVGGIGGKFFSLGLNNSVAGFNDGAPSSLIYGDLRNRVGLSVDEFGFLGAQVVAGNSFSVGNANFYGTSAIWQTYTDGSGNVLNTGAQVQGNLSVGINKNTLATGTFWGNTGAGVLIDSRVSVSSTIPTKSTLTLSGNYVTTGSATEVNSWSFVMDNQRTTSNPYYRSLTLKASFQGLTAPSPSSSSPSVVRNSIFMSLTAGMSTTYSNLSPLIGIDNTDPNSLVEIGAGANRLSLGEVNSNGGGTVDYISNYIGFNLARKPSSYNSTSSLWVSRTDSSNATGRAIWTNQFSGFNLSFLPGGGLATNQTYTDVQVVNASRLSISPYGQIVTHEWDKTWSLSGYVGGYTGSGLWIGFGPSGTTGSGASKNNFRRLTAVFGNGPLAGNYGSPLLAATNGATQNSTVAADGSRSILPQYTFWNSDGHGFYLSDGGNRNGTYSLAVGLAVGGTSAIAAMGDPGGGRVGIFQRNPLEAFHIGEKLVFHDGGSKFWGHNVYYDGAAGSLKRIFGSTAAGATQYGFVKMGFPEMGITSVGATTSRFANIGTNFAIEFGPIGGTVATSSNDPYHPGFWVFGGTGNRTYRGVVISPPLIGPTSTHTNFASYVPQMAIGLPLDSGFVAAGAEYGNQSAKRGTLAIAAQTRIKPDPFGFGPFGLTIEDNYNIGLYSSEGFPVAAIGAGGGNPYNSTTRNVSFNFIGDNGKVIGEDISFLYAESERTLANRTQRRAWFGSDFRIGINEVPYSIALALPENLSYDVAPLTVNHSDSYTSAPQQVPYSAIFRGTLCIDQSQYSSGNGGNAGIIIKDSTIAMNNTSQVNSPRTGTIPSNSYPGDWFIQYCKFDTTTAGLNFQKPYSVNPTMFLDDRGNVGIGTTNFNIVTSPGWPTNKELLVLNYQSSGTVYGSNIGGGTTAAKLAVNGAIQCVAIKTTSDNRLKDEILRIGSSDALRNVLNLSPVLFSWKESNEINSGFFAQEVEKVLPEAVAYIEDKTMDDGQKMILDYNPIVANAVGAIKELNKIIEEKDTQIKNLEDKLSKIEQLLAKHNIA